MPVETQLLSWVFWGYPQLILYTIVYSPGIPPYYLSVTAGFTCSKSTKRLFLPPPSGGCQAAEHSPFKILQCTSIHWLSFKTLRANPSVFNATLIQKQTRFPSNGRVSNTELFLKYTPGDSKIPLLKGNYVHRAVIANSYPKFSLSNRFNIWT